MIVVAGIIEVDPARRDSVVAAAMEAAAATRNEEGCISYEFFADLTDPGRFHAFEEWESIEALTAHLDTGHVKQFGAALRAAGLAASEFHRYEVKAKSPIG